MSEKKTILNLCSFPTLCWQKINTHTHICAYVYMYTYAYMDAFCKNFLILQQAST